MSEKLLEALRKYEELQLSVIGRKTGRKIPRPVWFVLRGNELLFLPVRGTSTQWYKNIMKNPHIDINVGGQHYGGIARTITDQKGISEIVELFKKKHGASDIKKYYPNLDAAAKVSLGQLSLGPDS